MYQFQSKIYFLNKFDVFNNFENVLDPWNTLFITKSIVLPYLTCSCLKQKVEFRQICYTVYKIIRQVSHQMENWEKWSPKSNHTCPIYGLREKSFYTDNNFKERKLLNNNNFSLILVNYGKTSLWFENLAKPLNHSEVTECTPLPR